MQAKPITKDEIDIGFSRAARATTKPRAAHLTLVEAAPVPEVAAESQRAGALYYIYGAIPAKGAKPGPDGRCLYILECFPMRDSMAPGEHGRVVFQAGHAQYKMYYGHIARKKGEDGITTGYVYRCHGSETMIDEAQHVMTQRPRVHSGRERFGHCHLAFQDRAEEIETLAQIDGIRHGRGPTTKAAYKQCCGGADTRAAPVLVDPLAVMRHRVLGL